MHGFGSANSTKGNDLNTDLQGITSPPNKKNLKAHKSTGNILENPMDDQQNNMTHYAINNKRKLSVGYPSIENITYASLEVEPTEQNNLSGYKTISK